jgi:hypothetical protein
MTQYAAMARKRVSKTGAAQKPRDRKPRKASRGGPGARAGTIVALVILAAAALWFARSGRPPWGAKAPGAADTLATLDPRAALAAGMRLGEQGQNARSVPYFRRAVAGLPGFWEARYDLSTALANAAVESRRRLGRMDPALRSSAERIGAVVESERELSVALEQASRPHNRAVLLMARAQTYLAWGMPVDALALLRQAHDADPAWEQPAVMAQQIEQGLALGGMAR